MIEYKDEICCYDYETDFYPYSCFRVTVVLGNNFDYFIFRIFSSFMRDKKDFMQSKIFNNFDILSLYFLFSLVKLAFP